MATKYDSEVIAAGTNNSSNNNNNIKNVPPTSPHHFHYNKFVDKTFAKALSTNSVSSQDQQQHDVLNSSIQDGDKSDRGNNDNFRLSVNIKMNITDQRPISVEIVKKQMQQQQQQLQQPLPQQPQSQSHPQQPSQYQQQQSKQMQTPVLISVPANIPITNLSFPQSLQYYENTLSKFVFFMIVYIVS
jgi:hypothetical protein